MKEISNYILEKLLLNKDIKVNNELSKHEQYLLDIINEFFISRYNIENPNVKIISEIERIGNRNRNTYRPHIRIFYKGTFPQGLKWNEVKKKLDPYLKEVFTQEYSDIVEDWWFSPAQRNAVDIIIQLKKK